MKSDSEVVNQIQKKWADEGKLIEGGWRSLEIVAIPKEASDVQKLEMRKAYFAGAQHLWASILAFLDPGKEPTEKDMERMILIHDELVAFYKSLKEQEMQ